MRSTILRILIVSLLIYALHAALVPSAGIDAGALKRASRMLDHEKYDAARGEIDKVIKANPSDDTTYATAIVLYDQARRFDDARQIGDKWLTYKRTHGSFSREDEAAFMLDLGTLYQQGKDISGAERAYSDAIRIIPDDPHLLNDFGYMYADAGIKLDDALRMTRRAAELAPNDGAIVDSFGWTQYKLRDYPAAIRTLRRAVSISPDEPSLRYHLGAAYLKYGKWFEAKIELSKALTLDSKMTDAANLLKTFHNHPRSR